MGLFRGLRGEGRGRGFLSCELVVLLVVLFAFVCFCFWVLFDYFWERRGEGLG